MKILCLKNKSDLLGYRDDIEQLFFNCFGKRSIGEVWDWAYINNPSGDPIVSLCYDEGNFAGHYAIVPMPIKCRATRLNTYVSMTTMVAETHRKFGLFATLAQATYKVAQDAGVDFVFGFPNIQSTPGFRKRLGWHLPEPDYVISIDATTLRNLVSLGYFDKKGLFTLDMADQEVLNWRLARPGGIYHWRDGLAFKEQQESIDLIWWRDPASLLAVPDVPAINMLIKADSQLERYKSFDYQFGGKSLCSEFVPNSVSREMAISDLF